MLNVILLKVANNYFMPSVIMLNAIMLNAIMLNVVMLGVEAPGLLPYPYWCQ
jgi:hypothetical protein